MPRIEQVSLFLFISYRKFNNQEIIEGIINCSYYELITSMHKIKDVTGMNLQKIFSRKYSVTFELQSIFYEQLIEILHSFLINYWNNCENFKN